MLAKEKLIANASENLPILQNLEERKKKKIKLNKRECPIPLVYIMAVQSVKKLKMVHKHVE